MSLFVPMENQGVGGHRADVVAEGEADGDRLGEPAQVGAQGGGGKDVLRRSTRRDAHAQMDPLNDPGKIEGAEARCLKRAQRQGDAEGAELEAHGLGGWIDAVAGWPGAELGLQFKGVGVRLFAELDGQDRLKGAEGRRCDKAGAGELEHHASVRRAAAKVCCAVEVAGAVGNQAPVGEVAVAGATRKGIQHRLGAVRRELKHHAETRRRSWRP